MKYPEEFVSRAKKEYPEWPGFSVMLEEALANEDDRSIGDLLESGRSLEKNINPRQIIDFISLGNMDYVKAVMEKCIRRQGLYEEWLKIRLHKM